MMSLADLAEQFGGAPELPKCTFDWNYTLPRMLFICVVISLLYYLAWFAWRAYYRDKQCRHCGRALVDLSTVVDNADLLRVPHMSDPLDTVAVATVNAFLDQLAERKLLVETMMTEDDYTKLMTHLTTVIAAGVQPAD